MALYKLTYCFIYLILYIEGINGEMERMDIQQEEGT